MNIYYVSTEPKYIVIATRFFKHSFATVHTRLFSVLSNLLILIVTMCKFDNLSWSVWYKPSTMKLAYTCTLYEHVTFRKKVTRSLIGIKCIVNACYLLASLFERVQVCEKSFGFNQRNADSSVNFQKIVYAVVLTFGFVFFKLRIGKLLPVYLLVCSASQHACSWPSWFIIQFFH